VDASQHAIRQIAYGSIQTNAIKIQGEGEGNDDDDDDNDDDGGKKTTKRK